MSLHIRSSLSIFLIPMMCLSGLLLAQNAWPPPPPSDANWLGFAASASGPLSDDGPSASVMSDNGDVYIAGPVGSSVKVFQWHRNTWKPLGVRLYRAGSASSLIEDIAIGANGDIYVCGNFDRADNGGGAIEVTPYVARWDAAQQVWAPVGRGTNTQTSDISVDVNNGRVYVVGPGAGINPDSTQVTLNGVGYWDMALNSWQPMGQGVSSQAMSILADSLGNAFVGGTFTEVFDPNGAAVTVNGIARWDGQNWHALGQGLTASMQPYPTELTFDRNGLLYVGGRFATAVNSDGSQVNGPLVSWDGNQWQSLNHSPSFNMLGMAVDGTDAVYSLNLDPNFNPPAIWKYDGVQWSIIGEFIGEGIATLAANNQRAGTRLFAGGLFWGMIDPGSGTTFSVINNTYWDGFGWFPMVGTTDFNGTVHALALRSSTSELFVGGDFSAVGGVAANHIARFDGASWSSRGAGSMDRLVRFPGIPSHC